MTAPLLDQRKRVALITGGSRGLGKAMALTLAQQHIDIAFTYLNDDKSAAETQKEIEKYQIQALALRADGRNHKSVYRAVEAVMKRFEQLDILINNMGTFVQKTFDELSIQDWNEMLASNLTSTFLFCKCVGPILKQQRSGRVINIGLANAEPIRAFQKVIPYAIAKHGVLILTKSLAVEWAPFGITVNAISPGLMNNGSLSHQQIEEWQQKVPVGRLGSGKDLSAALLYLISDTAEYVTGTEIIVSGGWGL